MKMQGHNNKLETNVENETQNFGIGNAAVVIEILRNRLYKHKVRTPVQEYICNARDAMREVGKGNEFEITVPNRLNPVFKVRDFGPGISPERMRDVFIMYGASTKRGTNNQTGGFGIGAKSAWSYTDSFTIVSIVDGTRRTYVAHTGVNNNGRLDLVTTEETDEQNGTEIQIAVKPQDLEEFKRSIFRTIYFWEQKPTLKGELNPPTLVRGEVVSDLLEVVDQYALPDYAREYDTEVLAIIDGIPYPINGEIARKVKEVGKLKEFCHKLPILHFTNGLVDVSATRESITDSVNTTNALSSLAHKALEQAKELVASEFKKVKNTTEYFNAYLRLYKYFQTSEHAKYKGYSINNGRVVHPDFEKVNLTLVHCMGKYMRGKTDRITKDSVFKSEIDIERIPHMFFVSKDEGKIVQNKRIREYFKKENFMILVEVKTANPIVFGPDDKPLLDKDGKPVTKSVTYKPEFDRMVKEFAVKDFLSITYVDPPKVKRERIPRDKEMFCLKTVYGGFRHTSLATNTEKWIYVPLDRGMWPMHRSQYQDLQDYVEKEYKIKICGVGKDTLKTIEGDPNFISIKEWLSNFKANKKFIDSAKRAEAKNTYLVQNVLRNIKDIDDKFINEMVEEYKGITAVDSHIPTLLKKHIVDSQEYKDFKEADEKLLKLIETTYPLVEELESTKFKNEVAFYMNAKYKEMKKGK